MATPYSDIYDLALISIQDYVLDKFACEDEDNFYLYLQGFLVRSIPKFNNCLKNLQDRNDEQATFNIDLDDDEKDILADWLVIMYLDKEIFDRKQITGMMQQKNEAHRYSEANLLKEKEELRSRKYEQVRNAQRDYSIKHFDWSEMVGGQNV